MWESNPPKYALAHSLTVLKTAPITGQDAPPRFFYNAEKICNVQAARPAQGSEYTQRTPRIDVGSNFFDEMFAIHNFDGRNTP